MEFQSRLINDLIFEPNGFFEHEGQDWMREDVLAEKLKMKGVEEIREFYTEIAGEVEEYSVVINTVRCYNITGCLLLSLQARTAEGTLFRKDVWDLTGREKMMEIFNNVFNSSNKKH